MILSKSFCIAPNCKEEIFGTFCEKHSRFVETAPGGYMQLGIRLLDERYRVINAAIDLKEKQNEE